MELLKKIHEQKIRLDRQDKQTWPRFSDNDRLTLYRRCGSDCFMRTDGSPQDILANPKKALKFPVCRVPRSNRGCAVSAAGLLAAERRARLTKKYKDVVEQTKMLIQTLGTTAVARKNMPVESVRLVKTNDPDKFIVKLTHKGGITETLPKPLSKRSILNRYAECLSPQQRNKVSS